MIYLINDNYLGRNDILRSISEILSCFFGPRPWHIEIRHRVKKTSTINLFGFETLKLKIRRLKLWKPTVAILLIVIIAILLIVIIAILLTVTTYLINDNYLGGNDILRNY